jgi:hypothetical protein
MNVDRTLVMTDFPEGPWRLVRSIVYHGMSPGRLPVAVAADLQPSDPRCAEPAFGKTRRRRDKERRALIVLTACLVCGGAALMPYHPWFAIHAAWRREWRRSGNPRRGKASRYGQTGRPAAIRLSNEEIVMQHLKVAGDFRL